jgi:putative transposase
MWCLADGYIKTRTNEAKDIYDYSEMFYNPVQKHSSNDMLSPIGYEKRYFMKPRLV